ncbi:hypothetical protein [Phaeocystidibacter luteus]|uniref:Uncharacterized protein n=1 Tax=Phaeocystidibacter luteus TaxID=911197 RepID=A0A6N6RFJ1_9FLAO|nr:hypothetical protein [Phaeocystidibacter luteus]KAB2808085.1 hypothetical protein F8C67_10980 [Phaeocystidibacter luteus]
MSISIKVLLALLFLQASFSDVLAQNPSGLQLEWGAEVDLRMTGYTDIAHIDDQFIYLYNHTVGNGFSSPNWEFVVLYRSSLEVAWKYRGEPRTIEGEPLEIVQVDCVDGVFRILLSHISPETGGMKLHLMEISENGMSQGYLPLAHFSLKYGDDSEKWLISGLEGYRSFDFIYKYIYQEGTDSILEIQRYDKSYNIVRVRVDLIHNLDHTSLVSLLHSDEGEQFLILEYSYDEATHNTLGIYKYDNEGVSISSFIDIPASEWSTHWFNFKNGNLEIGTLAVFDDETAKASIQSVSTTDLELRATDAALVPQVLIERMKERWNLNSPEDSPFIVSNVRNTSDGGSMITFQIQIHDYREDREAMDIFGTHDPELYFIHYMKDFMIVKVTDSSKVQWFSHIPLDQQAYGVPWSTGATFFSDADRQYILLNDDDDNLKSWARTFPNIDFISSMSIRNAKIVLIAIENDGTVYYEHIDDSRDEDSFTFGPNVSIGTTDGEAYLLRYNEKKRLQRLEVRNE